MTVHAIPQPAAPDRAPSASSGEEAHFGPGEFFFSKTDKRGVIESGNDVFQRLAEYSWDELRGAPHKIIRHPDMPRAVFYTMWQMLEAGEPVGAYVKNRTRSGRYYWVFAVVTPVYDGYISVRMKPCSKRRRDVEALYARLRAAELDEKIPPEESQAQLLAALADMGFDSYPEFAASSLALEIAACHAENACAPDPMLQSFSAILPAVTGLREDVLALIDEFEAIYTIPVNMRLIASRLEPMGGPVTTISENYQSMSNDFSGWLGEYSRGGDSFHARIRGAVSEALFYYCSASLQREVARDFRGTGGQGGSHLDGADGCKEAERLEVVRDYYVNRSREKMAGVWDELSTLAGSVEDMERLVASLRITTILCKTESRRLSQRQDGLEEVIAQLESFVRDVEGRISRIARASSQLLEAALPFSRRGGPEKSPGSAGLIGAPPL